jgi:broad specificity phosphatase PhoE
MARRVYLMRHGQAEHNVDQDFSSTYESQEHAPLNMALTACLELDDAITPLGIKQADTLPTRIPELQRKVDLIVTSPLRRALYTTLLGWKPAIERLGIANVVVLPEAQECCDFPCDTGSPREQLEMDPDFKGLEFSRLTPDWNSKQGFWAPDDASLADRAKFVRQFLRERPEKDIVLVCHGDFLRQLTADAEGPSRSFWKNVEMRVYKFDAETVDRDECFLQLEEAPEATRGYTPKTTEADFDAIPNGKM